MTILKISMFHPFFFLAVNPNPSCFFYSLPRVQILNKLRFFSSRKGVTLSSGVIFFGFPTGKTPWGTTTGSWKSRRFPWKKPGPGLLKAVEKPKIFSKDPEFPYHLRKIPSERKEKNSHRRFQNPSFFYNACFFLFWWGITGPDRVGLLPFLWFALLHQVSREELLAKLKADFAHIFSQGKKNNNSQF